MKLIITTILLLQLSLNGFNQIVKFKINSITYLNNKFDSTLPVKIPIPLNITLVRDYDKEKITIYTEPRQEYDIINLVDKKILEEANFNKYVGLDINSDKCVVIWVDSKTEKESAIIIKYLEGKEFMYKFTPQ